MVLSLAQVLVEKTNALRLLEEAYDTQIGLDRGRVVALDAVVKAARARGFYGSLELAAGVLRVSSRFRVDSGPAGRWIAVRQSTALVPVVGPRSTALVPVAGSRQFGLDRFLGTIPQG